MLYDVTLRIAYDYDNAADASRQIMRLMPLELAAEQRLIAGAQTVEPKPQEWTNRTDFFGNRHVELSFTQAHRKIIFTMQSRVERFGAELRKSRTARMSELPAEIAAYRALDNCAPHHFLGRSPRVPLERPTTDYARKLTAKDPSIFDAITIIGTALHGDMHYDPEATTVETPMLEAFERRHGVCQDYSHVMIAALRGIGIPAGYVSGFLRTIPPPGQPRLEGADAMHAWVRAWAGHETGWVEFDPTNAVLAGADHIVVARGRDYSDVAPVKGIMRTYGKHSSKQSVDVIPVARPNGVE